MGGQRIGNFRLWSLTRYRLAMRVACYYNVPPIIAGFIIRDRRGFEVFGWDGQGSKTGPIDAISPGQETVLYFTFDCNLAAGRYFLTLALAEENTTKHDMRFDAFDFDVVGSDDLHDSSIVNLRVRPLSKRESQDM